MSSLIGRMKTQRGPRGRAVSMGHDLARAARLVLACVVWWTGQAVAQSCAEPSIGERAESDRWVGRSTVGEALPGFELDPGLLPVIEADGVIIVGAEDQEPRPQWYCFEPVAEIEPVWQGMAIHHSFEVCNVGMAPLRVKARAG